MAELLHRIRGNPWWDSTARLVLAFAAISLAVVVVNALGMSTHLHGWVLVGVSVAVAAMWVLARLVAQPGQNTSQD